MSTGDDTCDTAERCHYGDVDCSIFFEYADIPSHEDLRFATAWKNGRWIQYCCYPTSGQWSAWDAPIFLAAQEAILDYFGLAPATIDLPALETTSPAALEMRRPQVREAKPSYPDYFLKGVTSFVRWRDICGPQWTGNLYRAERLVSGEWVVGRLCQNPEHWVVEQLRFTDLDMWRKFVLGPNRIAEGRIRSFRWKSIFLAHSSADKDFVRTIANRLKTLGVRVWVDEAEIRVGDSLFDRIQRAIDEADYVGVVLTPESVNSRWVQEELRMAMIKQLQDGRISVLPILLKTVDIPGFLREKRYADFRDQRTFDDSLAVLLERLREDFTDSQPNTSAAVM